MAEKEKKSKILPTLNPNRRFRLAILIIGSSFILLGSFVAIQQYSLSNTMANLKIIQNDGEFSVEEKEFFKTSFEEYNKNNQILFTTLLPLLAAWVGTVIAFYFGAENLDKAQETLQKAVETKGDKSALMTIKDLLDELPKAKDVVTVKLKDSIQEVDKSFSDNELTNVLVVDDEKRPLGILYKWNFLEKIKLATPSPPATDELNKHIDKIDSDFVSKKEWKKDEGNMNFATLLLKDTILEAKGKMIGRAGDDDSVLSVRGIIKNEEGTVSAIINFSNLTEALKN